MVLGVITKSSDLITEMDGQDDVTDATAIRLISQGNNSNGRETANGNIPQDQGKKSHKNNFFLKDGKLKKRIAAIILVLVIAIVIIISVSVCSEYKDDEDEKYDKSQFKLQQKFNGSFQILNLSNAIPGLDDVQKKIADLYESSPALGRFFKAANTSRLGSDPSVVQYQLTFVFPEEQQTELRNFTLSWEMVYNVFRQFLYDHEEDKSHIMFIDAGSLKMDQCDNESC